MIINSIDNHKRYIAEAHYIGDESWHTVHSTTNHPSSSYGAQVWVDDDGECYGQINLESALVEVRCIREITEEEAEAWEDAD